MLKVRQKNGWSRKRTPGEGREREALGCAGRTADKGRFGMTDREMERERSEDSENNNAIKNE